MSIRPGVSWSLVIGMLASKRLPTRSSAGERLHKRLNGISVEPSVGPWTQERI